MSDINTLSSDQTPTPPPVNPTNLLSTYEDCATLVASALADSSSDAKESALKQLKKFFDARIAKKAARDEKEGAGAVKRAIEGKRSFKQWTPTPKAINETPGGGLFNT